MKTILLCGVAPNQRALAHRLHAVGPLSAIIAVQLVRAKRNWSQSIASATVGRPLAHAWNVLMSYYDQRYPTFPVAPTIRPSANAPEVEEILRREAPDLVLVSGTDLLKQPVIESVAGRIMNLHTGISPFVKGAPNCTAWALARGEFKLIGNTIMWLDAGVDSGNIIATERTSLTGRESLPELYLKVMEHAHDLYCRAYRMFLAGRTLQSVPQHELGVGRVYRLREWNAARMASAVLNFTFRFDPGRLEAGPNPQLVPLEGPNAATQMAV